MTPLGLLFANGRWTKEDLVDCTFTIVEKCNDADLKTMLARKTPDIPAGASIEKVKPYINMYGVYVSCIYNGKHYNVKSTNVLVTKKEEKQDD